MKENVKTLEIGQPHGSAEGFFANFPDGFGQYIRIRDDVYLCEVEPNLNFSGLLEAADISIEVFADKFRTGEADARLFTFTNKITYNRRQISTARALGWRIKQNDLMTISNLHLGGRPSLWEKDNPAALKKSVSLFQYMFPDIEVSSGETVWKGVVSVK